MDDFEDLRKTAQRLEEAGAELHKAMNQECSYGYCPNLELCKAEEPMDCGCYGCIHFPCKQCRNWNNYEKG